MKGKVVIIGPAHPLRGGLASFNERMAKEFMIEDYQTSIYTFSLQYPSFLFPGTTQFSAEPAPSTLDIHVKINSINPLNWIKIGLELKKKQPDLIVVRYWLPFMGPCLGTILRIIKRNKKTKIVCIADNIIPHEKRLGDAIFTKYFIKPIDAFITMSSSVLNDLKQFTNKPAQEITHPLYDNFGNKMDADVAKKHLQIPLNTKIVLFFGFIRKYKGLDTLLEAIYILKQQGYFKNHLIQFLIAGEYYEDAKPYEDLIEKYQIKEQLIMRTEFIADSDVKYFLSCADCVIQPYKSATQSGVTPLAYHFEVPMIVTNVGGLPKLVPDTIGLIAEPNAQSIAEKIETFFEQNNSIYISNIQEEKKKYTWSKLIETIINIV
jgi:glycosyltransferase involved in cell wall biosynthesis